MAQPTSAPAGSAFATRAVHGAPLRGPVHSVATPIFLTSTFELESAAHGAALSNREDVGDRSPYLYSRWSNPTTDVVERTIADLEGGVFCKLTSSGMAAASLLLTTVLKQGDHVVCQQPVYSGVQEVLTSLMPKFGVEATFVDADAGAIEAAIRPNTRLLYGETPANPTMRILDLVAFAEVAARRGVLCAVDSTFASPANQTPLALGADFVVHSCTKYMGGHSDVVAGCVVTRHAEWADPLWHTHKLAGAVPSPMDAFLLGRGLRTLAVRVRQHNANAQAVAEFLEAHPAVERVHYPGLPSHPQHAVARRQMHGGFGGMVAFEVRGGLRAAQAASERTRLIRLAVSLGGTETLLNHAASTTHTMVSPEARRQGGITDGLIRLSVGLEDVEDLKADLGQALSLAAAEFPSE